MEYIKKSDNEMEVVKEAVIAEPVKVTYSIDFLKSQELQILKQINDYVESRKKELEEVRIFISEAEKLGLKTSEVLRDAAIISETSKLEDVVIK